LISKPYYDIIFIMKNKIYFDNAATSYPKPPPVADAMSDYLNNNGCSPSRGSYPGAIDAENALFDVRHALKEFFNASDESNVIFTPGDTWSLNLLIKGLARKGDAFFTSSMEHNSVVRPLHALETKGIISVYTLQCDKYGNLSDDDLTEELRRIMVSCASASDTTTPRAVVMTHGSNVTGSILPVGAAGAFCREHDLFLIVDAAQTAGIVPIDIKAMGIDGLCFSGHKGLFGPPGIGGMIISDRLAQELDTVMEGGTGSSSHLPDMPGYLPDRFEPGTLNVPGIYGLGAGLNHVLTIGSDVILRHAQTLTQRFISGLSDIDGLSVYAAGSIPVVSLTCSAMDPAILCARLADEFGIWTRSGLHCAPDAHKTIGTYPQGTVRFSFGYFNTETETDYCIDALRRLSS